MRAIEESSEPWNDGHRKMQIGFQCNYDDVDFAIPAISNDIRKIKNLLQTIYSNKLEMFIINGSHQPLISGIIETECLHSSNPKSDGIEIRHTSIK